MNCASSIFSQMLKLIRTPLIQRAVDEYRRERHSRKIFRRHRPSGDRSAASFA